MKKKSGIRHRWMVNNVSLMVLLILVAVTAAALAISSYYYSCMQSGLEAKLKTTADFFENYVSSSTEEFYSGVYGFTQSFEEKNTLELEFLSSDGEILCSSFGLAGRDPAPDGGCDGSAGKPGNQRVYRTGSRDWGTYHGSFRPGLLFRWTGGRCAPVCFEPEGG